jgi:hypothetical protein
VNNEGKRWVMKTKVKMVSPYQGSALAGAAVRRRNLAGSTRPLPTFT